MKQFNVSEFIKVYKIKVNNEDNVFKRFLSFVNDEQKMSLMFFLNDEYSIPPADLFTRLNKDLFDPIRESFITNKGEKQKLGAYFGFLFQFMYNDLYEKGKKIQIRYSEKDVYILSSASVFCRK